MWKISIGPETTTAQHDAAENERGVFVCGHGAGGNMQDRSMQAVAKTMRAAGLGVVRFNFLYKQKGIARPDQMPALVECVRAVARRTREELSPRSLFIGGRSLGGRAASMLAADGFDADGLLLLAYPLHPPQQPEKLRDAHLPSIRMPVLCFNGTRDEFCTPHLMERVLRTVATPWTMHWLDGADHSFHVLKKSGRTNAEVMDEVRTATATWLDGLRKPA